MRLVIIAAVVALAGAGTALAGSQRTLVTADGDGVTAASAKAKSGSLYLRGYGRNLRALAVVVCSNRGSTASSTTSLSSVQAGRLYRLNQPFGGDCTITASLGGSGRITLQLLA
jgi:hypothetical protein